MDQKTVAAVDEVLARFVADRQNEAERKEAAKARAVGFRREFLNLQDSVIVPALASIGDLVRNRGFDYEIDTAKSTSDTHHADPRTRLIISTTRAASGPYRPSLSAICDTRGESVRFEVHIPTRGSSVIKLQGSNLADLDQQIVHERAIDFLREVFSGEPL